MKWGKTGILLVIVSLILVLSLAVFSSGKEVNSPSNFIEETQIHVYSDKVIFDIDDPIWARFTDTNSMDPFIDEDSHAIQMSPKDPSVIQVGDVISYKTDNGTIIHRVTKISEDKEGIYFVVKGDNNLFRDTTKVRFEDVHGVVVAVIY